MANSVRQAAATDAELRLTVTRVFDAPREAVFAAWIDPAQIARWIGPRSISAEVLAMDARRGGAYRILFHTDAGATHTVGGVYREFIKPERLVFTWIWEDDGYAHKKGVETVVTVTFKARGGKTEMTLFHDGFHDAGSRDGHAQGWPGSFDKLAAVLAGKP